jgi:hypothetical protein
MERVPAACLGSAVRSLFHASIAVCGYSAAAGRLWTGSTPCSATEFSGSRRVLPPSHDGPDRLDPIPPQRVEPIVQVDRQEPAVLIDADNASAKIVDGLFEEVAKIGEASVRRIYGDFSGLGKISLFIGTHDLFIADARKLKDLLNKKPIPINTTTKGTATQDINQDLFKDNVK